MVVTVFENRSILSHFITIQLEWSEVQSAINSPDVFWCDWCKWFMTEKFPFQKCFLSRKSNKADIASNLKIPFLAGQKDVSRDFLVGSPREMEATGDQQQNKAGSVRKHTVAPEQVPERTSVRSTKTRMCSGIPQTRSAQLDPIEYRKP